MKGKKTGGRKKGTTNKKSIFYTYQEDIICYFKNGNSINQTLKKINKRNNENFSVSGFWSYIKKMKLDVYLTEKSPAKSVYTYKREQEVNEYKIDKDKYTIFFRCHKVRFPSGLNSVYYNNFGLNKMEKILSNYDKQFSEEEVYENIYEPILNLINEFDNTHIDKAFRDYTNSLNTEENTYNYSSKYKNEKSIRKKRIDINEYF